MDKEIKRMLFERQVDDDWDCSATKQMLNDQAFASAAKKKAVGPDGNPVQAGAKKKRLDIRVKELAQGFLFSKQ